VFSPQLLDVKAIADFRQVSDTLDLVNHRVAGTAQCPYSKPGLAHDHRRHVIDEMLGRVVGQRRGRVVVARTGGAFTTTALVEQDDAIALRIKKRASELWLPAPGPPCMTMTGSPAGAPYSSQ
jgi:hypothetical protein